MEIRLVDIRRGESDRIKRSRQNLGRGNVESRPGVMHNATGQHAFVPLSARVGLSKVRLVSKLIAGDRSPQRSCSQKKVGSDGAVTNIEAHASSSSLDAAEKAACCWSIQTYNSLNRW